MYDIIIIGAGIAGLTAAIYARRAGKSVLVLEQAVKGGAAVQTEDVENYPGFEKISGTDLTEKIYHQANNLNAEFRTETVEKVEDHVSEKVITTEDGDKIKARAVIIATGTKDRMLNLPHEKELLGHGLSTCPTCDGALYKNKTVIVVGGGNSALYSALYLADIAKKVLVIYHGNKFRADEILVEKVAAKGNVDYIYKAEPVEYLEDAGKLTGLIVARTASNADSSADVASFREEIPADALFLAIGKTPATDLFDFLARDTSGYIIADESGKTNVPGFFVAGDCRTKPLRQMITAAADGAASATSAIQYLNNKI